MATLGFTPNPASVSVKTGSYTVPANTYARAIANVIGTGTFTINGVTALAGTSNSVLASSGLKYATTAGQLNTSNTANGAAAFGSDTQSNNLVADFWLPSGTVINGTGTFRVAVEEYTY